MLNPTKPIGKLIEQLKRILPNNESGLHDPILHGDEFKYLKDCINTNYVSTAGKYVDRFENKLQNYTGAKYAVATNSGTSALHIALLVSGLKPSDEVLVPSLTFVATINAIKYCSAVPHFVDCEYDTFGVNPDKLNEYLCKITEFKNGILINKNTGARIHSLIPVHLYGHPVQIGALLEIAQKYSIQVIEDAAESLGSFYNKTHTGLFGRLGILSFNGNKIITTGAGGAILTNNAKDAELARHLTTTAKCLGTNSYFHDMVGYNYKMANINASIGCAQIEKIDSILENKRKILDSYSANIENLHWHLKLEPKNCSSNYWMQLLVLKKDFSKFRDRIVQDFNKNGIGSRTCWSLTSEFPMFKDCPSMDLSISKGISDSVINLPSNFIND